jgi:hypothetical protein
MPVEVSIRVVGRRPRSLGLRPEIPGPASGAALGSTRGPSS